MQTHCPHCETKFRVTETQVSAAEGLVRCGVCEEVFNINDVTDQTSQETEQQPYRYTKSTDADADDIEENPEDFDSFVDPSSEGQPDKTLESVTEESLSKYSNLKESKPNNADSDAYSFFDDSDEDSREHVVPKEFHDSYSANTHSTTATVMWSIGILILTATLFIEYIWFNRDQFTHVPEIQAEINKMCQQFDCTKLSLRAPSKIELVTRNIYSHPNEKDVLMVDVTMKNIAAFSQPYPIMKINFSDIRGGAVASRNFLPSEYLSADLQGNDNKQRLLPPDSSSNITMEIQDPGKLAMTYEFDFL